MNYGKSQAGSKMAAGAGPIIAITGNVTADPEAKAAAEALGRELAKAAFRILVYSSSQEFLECHVVRGYVASSVGARLSIQVRYPLSKQKPAFPEQQTHPDLFDWRPDSANDWEMSFYQSLTDVDGILLVGGGQSTLIAGLVAIGHGKAILPVAAFDGQARKVWETLRPERDLPSADDMSIMARPGWSDERACDCVKSLQNQLLRKAELIRLRRLDERRQEMSVSVRALVAALLFVVAMACAFAGFALEPNVFQGMLLLFCGPLLAGASGATLRLIFDLRQGSAPLTKESALTTGALGLVAGGAAGLLFIIAQVTALKPEQLKDGIVVSRLAAFGVVIGFVGGLTLDAVFRKLIAQDVVSTDAFDGRKKF